MNKESVEIIKKTKSKTLELVLTTILIAAGINLIVLGISSLMPQVNTYISIIAGLILIALSLGFVLYSSFTQSCQKRIVNAVVIYNKENMSIVRVSNYHFSEDIYKYLNAAISEDSNIMGMWKQDELGMTNIFNNASPDATLIAVSRSGAVLNQLIEYLVLKRLTVFTTDYFNRPHFNKKKIKTLKRVDVADLVASNTFLSLFSRPTYERLSFDNKPTKMVFGYGKNGAIYDRFELTLPDKCEVARNDHNVISIKHPYFKLTITPAFTGFGEVVPPSFLKVYLKQENIVNLSCFKVMIGIDLKFSWRAFFMNKTEYYKWIDNYIDYIEQYASFNQFWNKIQWNTVEAILLGIK